MTRPLVLVSTEGEEPFWHIDVDPGGNYGTLCGLSTDDDMNEVVSTKPSARQQCECSGCFSVWDRLTKLRLKMTDFIEAARRE